jgi:Domain of Unknown Function with PDB structure (DUF3857)
MKYFSLTLWCMAVTVTLVAQKSPVKFGKIDSELVKMTTHLLDTTADAVVLMDYGITHFRYDDDKGFYFELERITRVKILTKNGLEYGDFDVSYYRNSSTREKITNVKGYSYNYVNGKVEKSKLEKSSIFREEVNDNWDKVKVSMPDVKVGTVVEYTYLLSSPFTWNLQTWVFQSDIPTVHSEYKVVIPQYFDYQLLSFGYHPFKVSEKKGGSEYISIQTKSRSGGTGLGEGTLKTSYSTQKYDYRTTNYRWVSENVPAFKAEMYVASPSDYISKIKFELRGTQYPNSAYKAYRGTWNSLTNSFLDHQRFGDAIKLTGYMSKELVAIADLRSEEEKVVALVNLVRNHIDWNGEYRLYADPTLRKSWNEQHGSSADINLTIVAGLKKLGFESDPVLISTRGHGMIREQYAISSQFNSVLAYVMVGDHELLLDGTDRSLPIGVLPEKCLNGKGWKVSKAASRWIGIDPMKQEKIVQSTFKIMPNGALSGIIELTENGYSGYKQRQQLKAKGEESFFESFQNKNEDWLIDEYEYNSDADINEPFLSKYVLEVADAEIIAGDRIYFNPTLGSVLQENPFKLEKRIYPVDFAYPFSNVYKTTFTIPEGYKVEELPKPTSFTMPNKNAEFNYSISNTDNELKLVVDFKINKPLFVQTEYEELKQFYHNLVQKCEEQVVLKKSD